MSEQDYYDYTETFTQWYQRVGHKLDLSAIEEAFSIETIPVKGQNKASAFIGRLQPVHLGHIKIIQGMKNPIVILVKGKASSADKKRNPLSAQDQIFLLRKVFPNLRVVIAQNGYLPDIFADLRESANIEITDLYAGEDRIRDYQRMIERINTQLPSNKQFGVRFHKTKRFASATAVRKAIREDDYETFKKLMPEQLYDYYDWLKGKIAQ